MTSKPYFIIKKNLNKTSVTGITFENQLNYDILQDICIKITGQKFFDCHFVDNNYTNEILQKGWNQGRLAILYYNNVAHFITFSEVDIRGRDSSIQSVPVAYNIYYNYKNNKKIYYYFINKTGNAETPYHIFIYRLMKTIGIEFLNLNKQIEDDITPLISISDLMLSRRNNSGKNVGNKPSFITKSSATNIDIYGKTFGANKYATSLICYAILSINKKYHITLYQLKEGNLDKLPQPSLDVLNDMGSIDIVQSDYKHEKDDFEKHDSLRSPKYIYNLLDRLGNKKCAFCGCEIPEIIQGAHILPVAQIKRNNILSPEQKLYQATDAHNGLWLCENHHKLFDENIININNNGELIINVSLNQNDKEFINTITSIKKLPENIISEKFLSYLYQRNAVINF